MLIVRKVVGKRVAHENAAEIEEKPQLFVGMLETDRRMGGCFAVEITWTDARPFGKIVDDLLRNGNIVIDKR